MTYIPPDYNVGYFGNSSLVFYSPKTEEHPSVGAGDAVASNFFYCSTFDMYPEYRANTGEYIRGFPDRTVFDVSPIKIEGSIEQKMLARIDGSPDYVLARLFEHARHAWSGYAFTGYGDGSGVEGLPASQFSPVFSLFSDIFGIFSGCMVNSLEFVATPNEQVTINYGLVAQKMWSEDAPAVRNLKNILATNTGSYAPMRQVFSTDCAIASGNNVAKPTESLFALTSGGSSPFLKGYNFGDLPQNQKITGMKLKIENFLEPNYTMGARYRWSTKVDRDNEIHKRIEENLWPRNFYPAKPRQISGEISWITDTIPMDIEQRIAGGASNQVIKYSNSLMGDSMLLYFGPMIIHIQNPIWSLGKPELLPNQLFKMTVTLQGASDGELILQPSESWI